MTRVTTLSSPFLLGFEQVEATLDRISRTAGDSYPPYNIERLEPGEDGERLRITLAVAGFRAEELDVTLDRSSLCIQGSQQDDPDRDYLHRGIAARRFERSFVLAEGMEVGSAEVENGLLAINLFRRAPESAIRRIPVVERG